MRQIQDRMRRRPPALCFLFCGGKTGLRRRGGGRRQSRFGFQQMETREANSCRFLEAKNLAFAERQMSKIGPKRPVLCAVHKSIFCARKRSAGQDKALSFPQPGEKCVEIPVPPPENRGFPQGKTSKSEEKSAAVKNPADITQMSKMRKPLVGSHKTKPPARPWPDARAAGN